MKPSALVASLAIAAACSGVADHVLGPTTYVVDGIWLFEETLADSNLGISCNDHGLFTVTQAGPRFTVFGHQTGACTGPGATFPIDSAPVSINDGTIEGTTVRFSIPPCPYAGTAYGATPDSVSGRIVCQFRTGGQTVRLAGWWHIIPPPDRHPPAVSGSRFGEGTNGLFHGGDDTLRVRIVASDNTGLRTIGYELKDYQQQVVRRDSLLFSATDVAAVDDTLRFPLPLSYGFQGPTPRGYQATVFARDTASNTTTAAIDSFVVYPPPPAIVNGSLSGASGDSIGALTDTLDITVSVSSPRALAYVGYRLTNFVAVAESIATTDTSFNHVFRVPIPFGWKGLFLQVELFARDHLGLSYLHGFGNSIHVVVKPSRPTQVLRVGQGVSDLVYDEARQRLYLMTALDSTPDAGHPEMRVYSFASAGFLPGILVPWFADGLDLSPGNDSLLLTAYNGRLGIFNVNTQALDSTATITFPASNGRYPFKVRAMANGKAIIAIASAYWGAGDPGKLVEFDLASGTQTVRTDVGVSGDIGLTPLLARTPNRTRLLLYPSSPIESRAQSYQSSTNTFGTAVATPPLAIGNVSVSSDSTGSLWLVGNVLLDGNLNSLRQIPVGGMTVSVLSYDGVYAYVASPEGVEKRRTSDGGLTEQILLPDSPYRLSITPDGNSLIAIAGSHLLIVDLR